MAHYKISNRVKSLYDFLIIINNGLYCYNITNIIKTQPCLIFTERKELKPFTTESFIYSNVQKEIHFVSDKVE